MILLSTYFYKYNQLFLLKLKKKIDFIFNRGQTALHIAAEHKRRDITVILVASGADLSKCDINGCTPMMLAFNENATDIAKYLESKMSYSNYKEAPNTQNS